MMCTNPPSCPGAALSLIPPAGAAPGACGAAPAPAPPGARAPRSPSVGEDSSPLWYELRRRFRSSTSATLRQFFADEPAPFCSSPPPEAALPLARRCPASAPFPAHHPTLARFQNSACNLQSAIYNLQSAI